MKKFQFIIFLMLSINIQAQMFPVLEFNNIDKNAEIHKLDINVNILGNIAETTVDITFLNPNNTIMEGILKFPLTDSQEIVEFHLDVNGKLRKASVVEKEKGRVAYEATIRQNIDPGLLEKTKDNSFKARIFPIPAKGYKRALLKIQEELDMVDGEYKYVLPFKSKILIPEFSIKLTHYGDEEPQNLNDLDFYRWESANFIEFSKNYFKLDKNLEFKIPNGNRQNWVKDSYFYSNIDVSDLFEVDVVDVDSKSIDITILWDISASSNKRDRELEYDYLNKYIKTLNSKSTIHLILFNIDVYDKISFTANETHKLIQHIDNQKFDGGTSFNNLKLNQLETDRILLFTDGVSTFDSVSEPNLPNVPVDTVTSTYSSNTSLLRYFSIKTGGNYINLLKEQNNIFNPKLIKIEKNGVDEIYTDLEIDSMNFSICGKLKGDSGNIILTFLKADGSKVEKVVTIKDSKEEIAFDINRLWAIKKIESLDLIYDINKEEITRLGKKYGIVTRNTSLIVLDRVEDYVEYEIEPPEELKSSWKDLMSAKLKIEKELNEVKLTEALNEMMALKSWWNRDFPKDRPAPVDIDKKAEEAESFGIDSSNELMRSTEPSESSIPEMEMDAESPEMKISEKDDSNNKTESITVEGWTPDADYFNELKGLNGEKLLSKYYEIRARYKNRPSFFVDVATLFYEAGDNNRALLVISNVVEMGLEEPELLRITMYLLEKFGFYDYALTISLKLLEIRPEEPQTYRDIANLYFLNGKYQKSLEYYYRVLTGKWDGRFNGIKSVVLNEMNYLITKHKKELDISSVDNRLIFNMPLGVRSVISWSSDNNDIDLWVKDPYEEDCGYSNNLTHTGGKLSNDFTGGYGPEEYSIKEALYGYYIVDINFYSDSRLSVSGPVTIKVDIFKNYGKETEKVTIIRRLNDVKERITIGKVKFE